MASLNYLVQFNPESVDQQEMFWFVIEKKKKKSCKCKYGLGSLGLGHRSVVMSHLEK